MENFNPDLPQCSDPNGSNEPISSIENENLNSIEGINEIPNLDPSDNDLSKEDGKNLFIGSKEFRYKELSPIYPAVKSSVKVFDTDDKYGGAHAYALNLTKGMQYKDVDGEKIPAFEYLNERLMIQFVHKLSDDEVIPGITNEQLFQVLIDRMSKLNTMFPSPENNLIIECLIKCLQLSEARTRDRLERGVAGKLQS